MPPSIACRRESPMSSDASADRPVPSRAVVTRLTPKAVARPAHELQFLPTAPGRIVPTGHTKVVQPFEIGVVKAIYVRDGQSVKAGQALIELDSTASGAERDRLQSDLMAARL